jgi:hypothetical protein
MAKTKNNNSGLSVDDFLLAHSEPKYNVSEQPWIPVEYLEGENRFRVVSLRQLFLDAHLIKDITETDPLNRVSLRRLLQGIAIFLIQLNNNGSSPKTSEWRNRLEENRGFAEEEVANVFSVLYPHLFLYHPEFPFLQDLRILTVGEKLPETSADVLIPHISGEDSSAWMYKPNDPKVGIGLSLSETALGLVQRYFYGYPGNGGGGDHGGTFFEGPATITNVFRVDPRSLFCTFLRNISSSMMTSTLAEHSSLNKLGWLSVGKQAGGSPLYLSSVSVASTLLGPVDSEDRVQIVLRNTYKKGPETEAIRNTGRDSDSHAIIYQVKNKEKRLRIDPSRHPLAALNDLVTVVDSNESVRGVLSSANLWLTGYSQEDEEGLEFFLGSKAGTSTSPQWSNVVTLSIPSIHISPTWSNHLLLAEKLQELFAPKTGMEKLLRNKLQVVFDGPAGVSKWMFIWLDRVNEVIEQIFYNQITDPTLLTRRAGAITKETYSEATSVLLGSSRTAYTVVRNEEILFANIRRNHNV